MLSLNCNMTLSAPGSGVTPRPRAVRHPRGHRGHPSPLLYGFSLVPAAPVPAVLSRLDSFCPVATPRRAAPAPRVAGGKVAASGAGPVQALAGAGSSVTGEKTEALQAQEPAHGAPRHA